MTGKTKKSAGAENGGVTGAAVRKEKTRRRIMDAARTMFARKGFDATNVSDIVGKIKMSQGTFYYHFEDKKAVLLEMLGEFFERARNLAAYWAGTTDTSADAAMYFSGLVAGLLDENRELAHIIMKEEHNRDAEISGLIRKFYESMYEQTALALDLGVRLGVVRKMDTKVAAVAIVGMLKEVVFRQIDGGGKMDVGRIIEEISALQNYGIRPRGGKK